MIDLMFVVVYMLFVMSKVIVVCGVFVKWFIVV